MTVRFVAVPPRLLRIAFVAVIAGSILLLAGRAAVTVRDAELSDFRCFYEAARIVGTGHDPYDRAIWADATKQDPTRLPPCPDTFAYPLWTAMAMVPLAVLPEPAALAAWEAVLLLCLLGAVALLSRTWQLTGGGNLLLLIVLGSEPTFSAIANAQLGPVVLLGLAAVAYALERGRMRFAAAAWCLLLMKPNIVVLAIAGLPTLARSRRFAGHVALDAIVITVASLALVHSWPIDVVREILGQRLLADLGLGTLSAAAQYAGLPAAVGIGASIVALTGFVLSLPRRPFRPRELVAVLAIASFLITPYARPHDEVALAVCWAAGLACAELATGRRRTVVRAAVVGTAIVLPWSVTLLSLLGGPLAAHVLTILASTGLVIYALRRCGPEVRMERRPPLFTA